MACCAVELDHQLPAVIEPRSLRKFIVMAGATARLRELSWKHRFIPRQGTAATLGEQNVTFCKLPPRPPLCPRLPIDQGHCKRAAHSHAIGKPRSSVLQCPFQHSSSLWTQTRPLDNYYLVTVRLTFTGPLPTVTGCDAGFPPSLPVFRVYWPAGTFLITKFPSLSVTAK